jgi:PTS system nitrogen regulatory IIA component
VLFKLVHFNFNIEKQRKGVIMSISELLGSKDSVFCIPEVTDCHHLLSQIIPPTISCNGYGEVSQQEIVVKLLEREELGSTGVGRGIAFPHVRLPELQKPIVFLAIIKKGIEYNASDNKPCHIFLIIIGGKDIANYLRILGQLSRWLMNEDLASGLREADSPEKAFEFISNIEKENN